MYGNACALRESVFKDKIVLTKAIALEIITKTVEEKELKTIKETEKIKIIFKEEIIISKITDLIIKIIEIIEIIKTNFHKMELIINTELNSNFYITLSGCNNYERNIFMNAFSEIFKIDDKNRYIL